MAGQINYVDGVKFPASHVPSADANMLDDYEEGPWTPVLGGSGGQTGQTHSVQSGIYVKIGRLVVCNFRVALSAKGTITGNLQISGLPFAASVQAGISIGFPYKFTLTAGHHLLGQVAAASQVITFFETDYTGDSPAALSEANIGTDSEISGTVSYQV